MSDYLCVTNRALCKNNFLERVDKIAECSPAGIILREKDMAEEEYMHLAIQVMEICQKHNTACIIHNFVNTGIALKADAIHLPLPILRTISEFDKLQFRTIGTSCHSLEDVSEAERLRCSYITAGHIFPTDCKKGVPARGLDFLKNICENTALPVYAIGGINAENISSVRNAGAKGVCIMSGLMQCDDVESYIKKLEGV